MQSRCLPGVRVLISLGHRRVTGYVVSTEQEANSLATKHIESVLDVAPVFSARILEFTRWVADYYLCPWGDVLKAALPAGIALDEERYWVYSGPEQDLDSLAALKYDDKSREFLKALQAEPLTSEQVRRRFQMSASDPVVKKLRSTGQIDFRPILRPPTVKTKYDRLLTLTQGAREAYDTTLFTRMRSVHQQQLLREIHDEEPEGVLRDELLRGSNQTRRAALKKLIDGGFVSASEVEHVRWDPQLENVPETKEPEQLMTAQIRAVQRIGQALATDKYAPFLLFGVTGSGKTQVYIEAIRRTLALEKTALVLVPEIALTPFLWSRFFRAFGDRVAIQHSGQSPAVRYDLWRQIAAGRYPVVVGARSAVFAPLENIGLIVVDEEQEASFKQHESPPLYHARDCALYRARMERAVIVLGSATPSMESWFHGQHGRYTMLELPERAGGSVPPDCYAVAWKPQVEEPDMQQPPPRRKDRGEMANAPEPPLLTEELRGEIERAIQSKKQILLLQNRRGHSPFLICKSCGEIPMCPNCSVSLTFHRKGNSLRCHYCDHRDAAPERCPKCFADTWIKYGIGTQRLEDELAKVFPEARVLRMDSDTASGSGKHAKMVADFAAGNYDILAGTQMIAKGLDFSEVELAGVVRADAELFYPDFRATERGASLILQLAGRAGRRTNRGKVIVQTCTPDHPVIQTALAGDWRAFAGNELATRERSGYPPYSRLILIRAVAKEESLCARALLKLRTLIGKTDPNVEILGPAPAVVVKVEKKYRYTLLARTRREFDAQGSQLRAAVRKSLDQFRKEKTEPGVTLEIDVDPQNVG